MSVSLTFGLDSRCSASPSAGTPIVFLIAGAFGATETLQRAILRNGWIPKVLESAREFLREPRPLVASCVVLACDRTGDEFRTQAQVARERPEIPVIVMSAREDIPATVRAFKAGAVDFLLEPLQDDDIVDAVRRALVLGTANVARWLADRPLRERYASLSRRERQVMALVVLGRLNKLIGDDLGISEITVKAHRGSVMRKMEAACLPALVRMAAQLGLEQPSTRAATNPRACGAA